MFDIIGKVISREIRNSYSGRFSWMEIIVRECTAAESATDDAKNDIPFRFSKADVQAMNINPNDWVKVRFSLRARVYQRNGRMERCLYAEGVKIKLLYSAKKDEDQCVPF